MLRFGPDILHLVDDGVLKDIEFTFRDVICLKQNLQQWWNSGDTKCKWANQVSPSPVQSTPSNKQITFEKQYHDGRGYRVYGPKMVKVEGGFSPNADIGWFYFCKAHDAMVPLLTGYTPVIDGEDEAI